jgi:hypothetical protein
VPHDNYGSSFQETYLKATEWLSEADFDRFSCQNEQQKLFGFSDEQWKKRQASKLVKALEKLWKTH